MDINTLVIIGITLGVIALAVLVGYLKKKGYMTEGDLLLASRILGISSSILIEMKPNDKQIIKISEIVKSSIDSILKQYNEFGDIQKLKNEIETTIYNLCEVYQIEMTESRKSIINEMVNMILPLAIQKIIID